MYSSSIPVWT